MSKRATVLDVAKVARVGASTVSRFLRGVPVRPEAAQRIAAAVKALQYTPDESARTLRGGRSRTIGIVVPKVSNNFFSQATQWMEEEARHQGWTVLLLTHQDHLEQQYEQLQTLHRYRAEGVLLTAAPGSDVRKIRLLLPNVPVVAFDSFLAADVDSVLLRNRESARLATAHLLAHGYRRIYCVGAKPATYSIGERVAGYSEALAAAQLEPALIVPDDYLKLHHMLATALSGKRPPQAILALSDFATQHVLSTFEDLGLDARQRPAMISYDDFSFAALLDPPLSVVRQPTESMVRYALNALFRRIRNEAGDEVVSLQLPGELVLRSSCGCQAR